MGKTYLDDNGYLRFADSNKLVHRWMAYKKLYSRRKFKHPFKYYIIHHKDRNKRNNSSRNLQILTKRRHDKIHKRYTGKQSSKGPEIFFEAIIFIIKNIFKSLFLIVRSICKLVDRRLRIQRMKKAIKAA